jgi:uncharacterized membrane protein
MNSLSWFLYLADVISNLQDVLTLMAIIFAIASIFWTICRVVGDDKYNSTERELAKTFWFVPWLFIFSLTFAALIPSTNTIYLIAASEAGEMVVNTPEAKEVMSDLKEILNIQLDKLKE